jgi:hypothetical protein
MNRREKMLVLSDETLLQIILGKVQLMPAEVPVDAKLVGMEYSIRHRSLHIVISHPSFQQLCDTEPMPMMYPMLKTTF